MCWFRATDPEGLGTDRRANSPHLARVPDMMRVEDKLQAQTATSRAALSARLKEKARELGFALSGIAPATDADGFSRFRDWLARGFAGEMSYLHTQGEQRRHPDSILDTVRSVLMVGMEYRGGGKDPTPQ